MSRGPQPQGGGACVLGEHWIWQHAFCLVQGLLFSVVPTVLFQPQEPNVPPHPPPSPLAF